MCTLRSAAGSGMRSRSRPGPPRPRGGRRTAARTRAPPAPRSRSRCPGSVHRSIERPPQALGQVAPAQLLLGLALDLPDALAGEPQLLADLLQRARLLAVEAKAHLDHALLLLVQLLEHGPPDLLLEGALHQLQLHRGDGLLLERVPQLERPVLPHRAREREVVAGDLQQLLHLLQAERGLLGDLLVRGRPVQLARELLPRVADLGDLAGELLGKAEHARVLRKGVEDRLPHPPYRVGDELHVALGVEPLARLDEAERALVDQVEEGEAQPAVPLGVGDDEAEVGLHEALQGLVVAALDAAAELLFLVAAQRLEARDLPDVGVEAVAAHRAGLRLFLSRALLLPRRALLPGTPLEL